MLRKVVITAIFICSVCLNLFLSYFFIQQHKVVEVVDGDTFQLASGRRVRLMGVDAPEYNRCGGLEAKNVLQNLILNRYVFLTEETQETFGRSLALVYTEKGLINKIVLEDGWGRPDYRKNSQREVLTAAFHAASDNKKGIYSALCRVEAQNTPQSCFIKGNIDKNTYKKYYHLPECKQYNQIVLEKDIGEQCFETEDMAVKAGFTKASGCPEEQQIKIPEIGLDIPLPERSYIICPGYHKDFSLTFDSSASATIYPSDMEASCAKHFLSKKYPFPIYSVSYGNLKDYQEYVEKASVCNETNTISLFRDTIKGMLIDFTKLKKGCIPYTGGTRYLLHIPFISQGKVLSINVAEYTGNELQEIITLLNSISMTPTP